MVDAPSLHSERPSLTEREVENIEEPTQLRTPVVYEVVRRQGDEELSRPLTSLWWWGLAAGLSISFSLFAQAARRVPVPEAEWRPLIEAMGYPVGFLMVILSRQQLFTENTITVVLPVIHKPSMRNLRRLARLWCVVFLANMAGTLIAAAFCSFAPALPPETRDAMLEISREMMANSFSHMFFKGIASGFLIATMAWAIPSADTAKFHIIALMTYLIAIGGFTHCGRQHGGLPVADKWRGFAPCGDHSVRSAGSRRQYRRRDRSVLVDFLCASHEGDIDPAPDCLEWRSKKPIMNERTLRGASVCCKIARPRIVAFLPSDLRSVLDGAQKTKSGAVCDEAFVELLGRFLHPASWALVRQRPE